MDALRSNKRFQRTVLALRARPAAEARRQKPAKEMAQALLTIAGTVILLMGTGHFVLTLGDVWRPTSFTPTEDSVRLAMRGLSHGCRSVLVLGSRAGLERGSHMHTGRGPFVKLALGFTSNRSDIGAILCLFFFTYSMGINALLDAEVPDA